MEYSSIITVLALMQFMLFAMLVGKTRVATGIKAPAVTGDPIFERYFRVQQNSLENLVIFVPALWLFNHYWDARVGAAIGLLYIISRFIYLRGYVADPAKRGTGFGIGFLCEVVLVIGALIGAIMAFV